MQRVKRTQQAIEQRHFAPLSNGHYSQHRTLVASEAMQASLNRLSNHASQIDPSLCLVARPEMIRAVNHRARQK
jgi:hypothetical protein